MAQEHMKSSQIGIRLIVGKEMASYCHTKSGSSLKAGKKQLRVWLQYVCGVTEMLLDEPSGRAERLYPSFGAPLVFPWSPIDDSEMARNGFEDGSKWFAMGNTFSSVNEAGFVGLRTHVQKPMKLCAISWASNRAMKYLII